MEKVLVVSAHRCLGPRELTKSERVKDHSNRKHVSFVQVNSVASDDVWVHVRGTASVSVAKLALDIGRGKAKVDYLKAIVFIKTDIFKFEVSVGVVVVFHVLDCTEELSCQHSGHVVVKWLGHDVVKEVSVNCSLLDGKNSWFFATLAINMNSLVFTNAVESNYVFVFWQLSQGMHFVHQEFDCLSFFNLVAKIERLDCNLALGAI